MVDTRALRAREDKTSCEFESRPRHIRSVAQLVARLVWDEEVPGSSPGTPTKLMKVIFDFQNNLVNGETGFDNVVNSSN